MSMTNSAFIGRGILVSDIIDNIPDKVEEFFNLPNPDNPLWDDLPFTVVNGHTVTLDHIKQHLSYEKMFREEGLEVWFDCNQVIVSVYKLLQNHSEHPSIKGEWLAQQELLCDILHFFLSRWIADGGEDVPEILGGEGSNFFYDFHGDLSDSDGPYICYRIHMCDIATTSGGMKSGEPYLFLDELELLDKDEEDPETRWRENADPCSKPEYAAKINKFKTRLVGPDHPGFQIYNPVFRC